LTKNPSDQHFAAVVMPHLDDARLQHIQCTTTFNQASDASTFPDRRA
jgi:hypothetical protein